MRIPKWGAGALSCLALAWAAGASAAMQDGHVVVLTQVPCQFIESENGADHGFKTAKKADCDAVNAKTGAERLADSAPLVLKPGTYTFRVTNKNVGYALGFWLRDKDYDWRNPIDKLTKISVSGGGLTTGTTKDYEVTLKPGEYLYSCPLNPTPNYHLIVRE